MNQTYLLTGGNMGNPGDNLKQANELITKHIGSIIRQSSLYRTAAWGQTDQDDFLNQVLMVNTTLDAISLMEQILLIEHTLGRVRQEKYGPRIIDIDILFFNDQVINTEKLVIPHPQLQNRRFVLEPLHEIAPNFVHPVFQKTVHQLLIECVDNLEVNRIVDEV